MKHFSILRSLAGAIAIAAVVCGSAQAQIYNNGPFVTHPGAHVSGGDVSQLQNQTITGHTLLGATSGTTFRLADDFTVPVGQLWTLTGANVFAYQTNQSTALPFTAGNLRIWSGDPAFGGTIVFDGSANNTLVSSTLAGFRIAETTNPGPPFTDTARGIRNNLLSLPNVVLGAGQYWLDFNLTGPIAGSVFTPPVTRLGQVDTSANGEARQFNIGTNTWTNTPLLNGTSGGSYDIPFLLQGSIQVIPEPSSLAIGSLALVGLALRRRRR